MRKVITVDGLAGSGKSTLARLLAEKIGFVHFNSGLLYRAVAFLALREAIDPHDAARAAQLLDRRHIALEEDAARGTQLLIDGQNATAAVRSAEVSGTTPIVAAHREVRQRLVRVQHEIFPGRNIVAEGRDMGTVIFPESPLKFYVNAELGVRMLRCIKMLYGDPAGMPPDRLNLLKEEVEKRIVERDRRDQERAVAPLKPAADAVMIDNSMRSLTEIVQSMYDAALRRGLC